MYTAPAHCICTLHLHNIPKVRPVQYTRCGHQYIGKCCQHGENYSFSFCKKKIWTCLVSKLTVLAEHHWESHSVYVVYIFRSSVHSETSWKHYMLEYLVLPAMSGCHLLPLLIPLIQCVVASNIGDFCTNECESGNPAAWCGERRLDTRVFQKF